MCSIKLSGAIISPATMISEQIAIVHIDIGFDIVILLMQMAEK